MTITNLLIGFFFALLISAGAWRVKALTLSGAAAAVVIGTLVFGFGGIHAAIVLILFFISSSLLSRLKQKDKKEAQNTVEKGSQRDWLQVAANGAIPAIWIILTPIFPNVEWIWIGFAAAFASANADTWSTEIGILSKSPPRKITNWQIVSPGTSGGITLAGSLASAGGALFIAISAVLFRTGFSGFDIFIGFLSILFGGIFGAFIDSLLGATLQAVYSCPQCKKDTEKHPLHSCGSETSHKHGLRWINNDMVNLICTLSGSLAAVLIWILIQ